MYGRERIQEIGWEKGDRSDPTANIPIEQLDLVAFANHALGQSPAGVGPHLWHKAKQRPCVGGLLANDLRIRKEEEAHESERLQGP